jgi:hypothetical protein
MVKSKVYKDLLHSLRGRGANSKDITARRQRSNAESAFPIGQIRSVPLTGGYGFVGTVVGPGAPILIDLYHGSFNRSLIGIHDPTANSVYCAYGILDPFICSVRVII